MTGLRNIPIYRALSRSGLVLGCDRELLLFSGLTAANLVFVAATLPTVIIGTMLWFACLAILRKMGKADPKLRHVYLRHIRYRKYYPAKATPFALGATWQRKKTKISI